MNITRETVNIWLEKHRRNREWLAEKCETSLSNVGMWLNKKGTPREIPGEHKIKIRILMEEDAAREQSKPPHHIVLDFDDAEFAAIEQAALDKQETVRQWAKRTLNEIASVDAEDLVSDLRRGNNFGSISTDPVSRHLNEPTQVPQDRGSFDPLEMRDGQ